MSHKGENGFPKLIATDLDGTLLTSEKHVSDRCARALMNAWKEYGTEIVPTTGRMHSAIPADVLGMECVRYLICENGARIYDMHKGVFTYCLPVGKDTVRRLFSYLEDLPVIFDCYMDDRPYMPADQFGKVEGFLGYNPRFIQRIFETWIAVEDWKGFLEDMDGDVTKIQFYIDPEAMERAGELKREVAERFPEIGMSSTWPLHVEVGNREADKSGALKILTDRLGIPLRDVTAFGDGDNDVAFIRTAGRGVAMKNSLPQVRKEADDVTDFTNDEDGVGEYIERLLRE